MMHEHMPELLLIYLGDQFVRSCVLIAAMFSLRFVLVYLIKRNRAILTEGRLPSASLGARPLSGRRRVVRAV